MATKRPVFARVQFLRNFQYLNPLSERYEVKSGSKLVGILTNAIPDETMPDSSIYPPDVFQFKVSDNQGRIEDFYVNVPLLKGANAIVRILETKFSPMDVFEDNGRPPRPNNEENNISNADITNNVNESVKEAEEKLKESANSVKETLSNIEKKDKNPIQTSKYVLGGSLLGFLTYKTMGKSQGLAIYVILGGAIGAVISRALNK